MIQIPDPCGEDWSKMKIVREGRHCLSCTKTVVDFTKMERYEIIEYLLLNKDKSVCGHINKNMLDFDVEELYVTVQRVETVKRSSNLAFCILSMGALFLASCSNETTETKDHPGYTTRGVVAKIEVPNETKKESNKTDNNSISNKKNCNNETNIGFISPKIKTEKSTENTIAFDEELSGLIVCPTVGEKRDIYDYTNPSPEFPGGMSAMRKYLMDSIRLPADFEEIGKIYVRFVVSETGNISNVKIIRNFTEDERLKTEIVRLLKAMPNWIPGQVDGKNVNSYFTLPITIDIDK